jgi:DNA-binding beta-propeller fold protein YncE
MAIVSRRLGWVIVSAVRLGLTLWMMLATVARVAAAEATEHREYVVLPGTISIYDIDADFGLLTSLPLPPTVGSNIKGVAVSVPSGILFVSYGGDGGPDGTGSLLAYDLVAERVMWSRSYPHGIDSMAITADGGQLYMPVGEAEKGSFDWVTLDTSNGDEIGTLQGGRAPHNTVIGGSGRRIYLAGREDRTLYIRNLPDGSLFGTVGPFVATTRPFTVNGAESLVFVTETGLLGFQVARVSDGQVIYTVAVDGFNSKSEFTTPSHGISLSPDEREVYLVDTANAYVHVFAVSGLPDTAPARLASIKLSRDFSGEEAGCGTGWCGRISWLQHTLDGRFVLVGDEGDVISTETRQIVAHLPALRDTRKMLEIDWANGAPIAASPREGLGYLQP